MDDDTFGFKNTLVMFKRRNNTLSALAFDDSGYEHTTLTRQ